MAKLYLAAFLVVGSASVQAQPPLPKVEFQPSTDSGEQRRALRTLSSCLAEARPGWARRTLSHPYLSSEQASIAAEALSGRDNCVRKDNSEVTFRTSGLVGSLAEHFVQVEIGNADFARLGKALSTLKPLNASEDFALCVASRDPARARDLALSDPGSAAELAAVHQVSTHVPPCINEGEKPVVELQSLRALISTALYRGLTTVKVAGR